MRHSRLAREIVETIVLTLLIFLAIRFVIQSYHVGDVSMQPAFNTDQNVLVNKVAYFFRAPERGDVIVFHNPGDTQQDFIKRVIGVPGDTIKVDGTNIWVNGVLLKEPYVQAPVNPIAKEWKLKPDQVFVMGDNRGSSLDSRNWGPLDTTFIVGKVVAIYWPVTSWSFIETYPAVFASLPAGE